MPRAKDVYKRQVVAQLPVAAHDAFVDVDAPALEVGDERVRGVFDALLTLLFRIHERHVPSAQRSGGERSVRHALQDNDFRALFRRRIRCRTACAAATYHHDVGFFVPRQRAVGQARLSRVLPACLRLRRAPEQRCPHGGNSHRRRASNEIPPRRFHPILLVRFFFHATFGCKSEATPFRPGKIRGKRG